MPGSPTPDELRRQVADAFRRAYESYGLSQVQVADALGVEQTTVSKYARGTIAIPLEVLFALDRIVGQKPGYTLRAGGLIDDQAVIDARTALLTDEALRPDHRRAIVEVYDGFRALGRLARPG